MPQALETRYDGHRFRSRLEARWAVFFNTLGLTYSYEPEGFQLSNGERYLPDFWLPDLDAYLEVKPTSPSLQERRRCQYLAHDTQKKVFLAAGPPAYDVKNVACYETTTAPCYGFFAWCRRGDHLCFFSEVLEEDTANGIPLGAYGWDCFGKDMERCADRLPVDNALLTQAITASRSERFGVHE